MLPRAPKGCRYSYKLLKINKRAIATRVARAWNDSSHPVAFSEAIAVSNGPFVSYFVSSALSRYGLLVCSKEIAVRNGPFVS